MGIHLSRNALLDGPMVFSGHPFCTVSQFSQYHTHVDQLPGTEQKKVKDAADCVINSYLSPALTGGIIVAIGIRGHADQDLLKSGQARLDFEQKISEDRAREVARALMKAIRARAFRIVSGLLPSGEMFEPIIKGMGARMLLYHHPVNEYQRSLNRRVEIFLKADWASLAHMGDFGIPVQKDLA